MEDRADILYFVDSAFRIVCQKTVCGSTHFRITEATHKAAYEAPQYMLRVQSLSRTSTAFISSVQMVSCTVMEHTSSFPRIIIKVSTLF
jgi:hypothetical protein